MKKHVQAAKRDVLGVFFIILSGLTGWLPGPGGFPFLFLGLGFLATNHKWAADLLDKIKNEGRSFLHRFIPEKYLTKKILIPTLLVLYLSAYGLIYGLIHIL